MASRVSHRRILLLAVACTALTLWVGSDRLRAQGDARERTIFVSVTDRMNNPVDGLALSDFIVREDGIRREVLRVSRATEPIDVAVLVDNAATSGSLVPRVREGAKRLVATLTPQNPVALVALADRPTILTDYTTSGPALDAGIGRLFTMTSSGMTLLDGLVEVSRGLQRRESVRAAIVAVVTDGTEFTSHHYADVNEALKKSGAAFYPITVGRFELTTDTVDQDRANVLNTAPAATGGRRFDLLISNAVEATMVKVGQILTSQYKVVYNRPETLIPPEKIDVGTSRPDLTASGTPAREATRSAP